jgi:hypothetical protein
MDGKGGAAAKIQIARGASVSELRAPAWLYEQVSNLPYLFPRAGLAGQDSRRGEIELVRRVNE